MTEKNDTARLDRLEAALTEVALTLYQQLEPTSAPNLTAIARARLADLAETRA